MQFAMHEAVIIICSYLFIFFSSYLLAAFFFFSKKSGGEKTPLCEINFERIFKRQEKDILNRFFFKNKKKISHIVWMYIVRNANVIYNRYVFFFFCFFSTIHCLFCLFVFQKIEGEKKQFCTRYIFEGIFKIIVEKEKKSTENWFFMRSLRIF